MKDHSASMQPTMNLDTSARTLNTQASLKCSEVNKFFHHDFFLKNLCWSPTSTVPCTTSFGEGLSLQG